VRGLVRALSSGGAGKGTAAFRKKQLLPSRAYTAGFSSSGGIGSRKRITELQKAAGGTDETVTWARACINKIAEAGSIYPWALHEFTGNPSMPGEVLEAPDPKLLATLVLPNPRLRQTYRDATYFKLADLETAGNSYWLKDQRNGLGQPLSQLRLRPELVRIAKDKAGNKLGYVYFPLGTAGTGIPYDLDEVIHYRYPSLLDDLYGMGTLEAIVRAVNTELSQSEHVMGFFDNGARVGGLLITDSTVDEDEFEGMKEEFNAEVEEGEAGAYGVVMVEHAMKFEPITIAPPGSGVIELRSQSKDELLSGFGVHEFMLGGAAQSGTERMVEALRIFHETTMPPKTNLLGEQTTLDLTALWSAQLIISPERPLTQEERAAAAKAMTEAGASLNQALRYMQLPESDHKDADKPLMASGVTLFGEKQVQQVRVETGPKDDEDDDQADRDEPDADAEGTAEEVDDDDAKQITAGTKDADVAIEYPAWAEDWGDWKAEVAGRVDSAVLTEFRLLHARCLNQFEPRFETAFVRFFAAQEGRVRERLWEFEKTVRLTGGKTARATKAGNPLEGDSLWREALENAKLDEMYLPIVDQLGGEVAGPAARIAGGTVQWDLELEHIGAARDRVAALVKRINETTRKAIKDEVLRGIERSYSIRQIANGVPGEEYRGIAGVFVEATEARAETIARSETAMVYNAAANAGYRAAGIEEVIVLDGTGDAPCAEANGSTWTIDRAEENPIGHPNCVRTFVPKVPAE
jgi:HK97 family phage portal protein